MVKEFDKANILKQKEILSILVDVNAEVTSEYEVHKMLQEAIAKLKEENNIDNFSLGSFVQDTTLIKWKQNANKESDYFVKMFFNEIKYAKEKYDISKLELNFLYSLFEYMSWQENLLIDNEGVPLNQKRLCEILEEDRKKVYKCTKSLEEKKCLLRIYFEGNCYYMINPNLAFKGVKINKGIPKIFEMIGYECSKNQKK